MIRFHDSGSTPRPILVITLAVLLALSVGVNLYFLLRNEAGEAVSAKDAAQLWTCGMHPQVIQDHPGTCPICGMNLTPMNAGSAGSNTIQIDPSVTQNIGLKSAVVERRDLRHTIRTSGVAALDDSRIVTVNLRYMGWIEELHAGKTGQYVRAGEPLFEIFSPDLLNAQDAFLIARSAGEAVSISARDKLLNLGMSEAQIEGLTERGEAEQIVTVYSPATGFILEKNVTQGAAAMAGTDLITIATTDPIWVIAQVYDYELPWVHERSPARVKFDALAEELLGNVSFVYPTLDPGSRAVRMRISVGNSEQQIKPEMVAQIYLSSDTLAGALCVPRDAVVRSGTRDIVFVAKDGGHVEPRQVQLGLEADDYLYEIRTGVREGERVVTSAAFLLDSETQLQEALKRLSGDSSSFVTAFTPQAGKEPVRLSEGEPTLRTEAAPEDKPRGKVAVGPTMDELFLQAQLFICPTHDAIVDDEKNTVCPLCKSALVALDSAEVTALRMAEPFGCVMCPVIVPGTQRETRCPICNMKLTAIENPTRK